MSIPWLGNIALSQISNDCGGREEVELHLMIHEENADRQIKFIQEKFGLCSDSHRIAELQAENERMEIQNKAMKLNAEVIAEISQKLCNDRDYWKGKYDSLQKFHELEVNRLARSFGQNVRLGAGGGGGSFGNGLNGDGTNGPIDYKADCAARGVPDLMTNIKDLIAEHEQDPRKKAALDRARVNLSRPANKQDVMPQAAHLRTALDIDTISERDIALARGLARMHGY